MNLGELKKSLAKHPPDMDDMEMMVLIARNGKKHYEPLSFVGYMPMPGNEFIVLGSLTAIQNMVENGELEKPPGYIDPEDSDPLIFGKEND